MSTTTKVAHIDQKSANKPPFLTVGQLTPEVLKAWEQSCNQFFLHRKTKDEDKVRKVAWGMQDPLIQDWYLNNQDRLDKLAFKEKMLVSTQGQHPFSKWAIDVQSQNTLLCGTVSHLTDIYLLYYLESHMNADLAANYYTEGISEKDLHEWIEKVCLLDERRLCYLACFDTTLCADRTHSNADKKTVVGNNTSRLVEQSTSNTTSTNSGKTFTRLPTLSDTEHQLLRDNNGCFKC
ncbi:hypothetical protein EDD22DRAFT_956371 [Suillus occidentalis]|nr:hypothetical protein EDD22DRAFT_956371 [Suillus occidentalis]